jgi:hypothetical protein
MHGAIGLRTVAQEWLAFRGEYAEVAMTVVAVALAILGLRGVAAVVVA